MLFNAESAARSVLQVNAVMHVVMENSPEDPVSVLPVQYLLTELQNIIVQAGALHATFGLFVAHMSGAVLNFEKRLVSRKTAHYVPGISVTQLNTL